MNIKEKYNLICDCFHSIILIEDVYHESDKSKDVIYYTFENTYCFGESYGCCYGYSDNEQSEFSMVLRLIVDYLTNRSSFSHLAPVTYGELLSYSPEDYKISEAVLSKWMTELLEYGAMYKDWTTGTYMLNDDFLGVYKDNLNDCIKEIEPNKIQYN